MRKLIILICVLLMTGCVTLRKDLERMTPEDYMRAAEQTEDSKVTALSEMTDVQGSDVLYIIDAPGSVPASEKITVTNLFDIIDTSAELRGILTDETGTGVAVFGTAPTFITSITMGSAGLNEAELEILDGATLTTTELNYVDGATSAIQAQLDLKAPLASPALTGSPTVGTAINPDTADGATIGTAAKEWTALFIAAGGIIYGEDDQGNTLTSSAAGWTANQKFTATGFVIGSADINEAELEAIDGNISTTTQLNYLNAATGITGTGTTNLVYSGSPVLTGSPSLAAATATSLTLSAAAFPEWIHRDSDGAGTDKTCAKYGASFSTTTDGGEISDFAFVALGSATAGTEYTHLFWDSSDSHLYMGVLADYTGANPSIAPLDVANYESLVWDFDYDTDTVAISSPVSGTTAIKYSTIDIIFGDTFGIVTEKDSSDDNSVWEATDDIGGTPTQKSVITVYNAGTGDAPLVVLGSNAVRVNVALMATADEMADDKAGGTLLRGINAGEAVDQWQPVYLEADGKLDEADANDAGHFPALGIAITSSSDGNECRVLTIGVARNEGWTGLTVGGTVYLSETPTGDAGITQTAPSDSTDCVQKIGVALSDSEIYFNFTFEYSTVP